METRISCKICGGKFKAVTNTHLKHAHGISAAEYKSMFPGVKMESEFIKSVNDEHRRVISKLPQSLEARSETGKSNKGKKRSSEWKKKRSRRYSGEGNPFYGKTHSFETRKKISAKHQGIEEVEWLGFTKRERDRDWVSKEAKIWRHGVFSRDNYTCVLCGKRGGDLNAHHVKKWNDYPELIHDVDNGVTLCVECHKKTYGKEKDFEPVFVKFLGGV